MTDGIADTLRTAAAAVTGGDTPNSVRAITPTRESVRTLLIGMAAASCVAVLIILLLSMLPWPTTTAESRIRWLGVMGVMAQFAIPVTIIALASSRLGRVEASAGDTTIKLEGRDEQ